MPENNKELHPLKCTLTFEDGHTEDFDTFVAIIARGLTPVLKEGGRVAYMATEETQVGAICHMAADSSVYSAFLVAMKSLVRHWVQTLGTESLGVFLDAMQMEDHSKAHIEYQDHRTIRKDPSEN